MPEVEGDHVLARQLEVLSSPVRLQIVRQLREPKPLKDIRASTTEPGGRQRPIARQTVREHLDRLAQVGVVVALPGPRGSVQYVVDQQRIFAMNEEFASLVRLRPVLEVAHETILVDREGRPRRAEGPCLVLVRGLDEGRSFRLEPRVGNRAVIGRRRDCEVPLDYDPYVSTENTVLSAVAQGFHVESLAQSRNGTTLNFRTIAPGTPHLLQTGDVIGVGRSLLLFRG